MVPVEAKIDVNEFYKLVREDIKSLIGGAGVNAAVIFNNTAEDIEFHVYNYIDTLYAIPAMKTRIASKWSGTVACSGTQFKVHPRNQAGEQKVVEPGKAYVYHGPGKWEQVK